MGVVLRRYAATCPALPATIGATLAGLSPIVFESVIKMSIWGKIVDHTHGVRHPRLYAAVDLVLSITSIVTGPLKTLFRLAGASICLFVYMFRSDCTLMLDERMIFLDPHFKSSTGLLMALRVKFEFSKIRRCDSRATQAVDDGVQPEDSDGATDPTTGDQSIYGAEAVSGAIDAAENQQESIYG